jgi:guanylate kinase
VIENLPRRGLLLILSSPSGAGKSTLTRLLKENDEHIKLSVSATTRPRRPSEVDNVHYRFVTLEQFTKLRDRGELLEWAEVHGNHYGTPRDPVDEALRAGQDMLFDIDWRGTRQIMETCRQDAVSVFILPPSMEELRHRLERRAEDSPQVIDRRLANARDEIAQWATYDYVLINEDVQKTFEDLQGILTAERLRRERQAGLEGFIMTLLDQNDASSPSV